MQTKRFEPFKGLFRHALTENYASSPYDRDLCYFWLSFLALAQVLKYIKPVFARSDDVQQSISVQVNDVEIDAAA